jgi:predicted PolB exonuclease-like 3'-5' exonuclease
MLPTPQEQIWFLACASLPDPQAGRLLGGLPPDTSDADALAALLTRQGATPGHPFTPLAPALSRVVAIAAVLRRQRAGESRLELLWLPRDCARTEQTAETSVIGTFLQAVGKFRPQLVGYGSYRRDFPLLMQRALVLGLHLPEFCRPPRSTEPADDYFAPDSRLHLDLSETLGRGAEPAPSPGDLAVLAGIPGHLAPEDQASMPLWLEGKLATIVQQSCFRALSTYLLWMRLMHLAGHLDRDAYDEEQQRLLDRLLALGEQAETEFLNRYVEEWERLKQATGQ